MAPVLLYAYVRLARSEEQYMISRFGDNYIEYMRGVPAFFPPTTCLEGVPGPLSQ
jgi:protein-S-isoprenylcysteine O-methyltransferase Ste14